MAIKSIYNFAPLNEKVYTPSWGGQVSQDKPFSDGEDGTLTVSFTNVSPIFVRDKNDGGEDNEESRLPAHIKLDGDNVRLFIPATSIKGMLRSTMEVLAFGRLSQYKNRSFGHREVAEKTTGHKKYQEQMENVQCGWLTCTGDDKYYLRPCGVPEKIRIDELPEEYRGLDGKQSSYERNSYVMQVAKGCWYPCVNGKGNLVCTGKMAKKAHEFLFPLEHHEKIELDMQIVSQFMTIHEQTPDFEKLILRLEAGEEIPVFYLESKGKVTDMGIARMMKVSYSSTVGSLVNGTQKGNTDGPDLCDIIWGNIRNDKGLRGRVQVTPAFDTQVTTMTEVLGETQSGVLGEPKPSFYPTYVDQSKARGNYRNYDNAESIAGRKHYRVHQGSSVIPLPQGNDNENTMSHFKPVKAGRTFVCKINVHNLRKVEIGALLSAVTMHNTPDVYHNLGLAKGYGYGKLKVEITRLDGFKHSLEDYLAAFETEMTKFVRKSYSSSPMWSKRPEITTLMAIHSEHTSDGLSSMDYKECGEVKVQPLAPLSERLVNANSSISEEKMKQEGLRDDLKNKYDDYHAAMSDKRWGDAENIIRDIIDSFELRRLPHPEEDEMLNDINKQRNSVIEEVKHVSAQPDTFPEAIGNPTSVGALAGSIRKWLNAQQRERLNDDEQALVDGVFQTMLAGERNKRNQEKMQNDFNNRIIKMYYQS